jgi:Raf kinase inhibitor-like YbhB/YbcL family protein
VAWAIPAAATLAGCGAGLTAPNPLSTPPRLIEVESPAFAPGGAIPSQFTCQGQDISPPLRWSGVPHTTRELDLVMRDPDAPGGNFIHWQLTDIPPTTRALAAGQTPAGARPARNSFGSVGYRGPCPPPGRAHHYVITLNARSGAALLATGSLTGTYARR